MLMTKTSYDSMNELVGKCFNANAIIDNLAYSLDYHYYTKIAEVVHHHVAHVMPAWADMISDQMLKLSARPVRKDIGGYEKDYEDLKEIFETLKVTILEIRQATRSLIEAADLEGDDEVRIFAEKFLEETTPFIKQAEEWLTVAKRLDANTLNIHIHDYTHFIAV